MKKATEIEFKYRADEISLAEFAQFCKARNPDKVIVASGYDHFFESAKDDGGFYRHRVGADMNQLTYKRKTVSTNNFIRSEHNLDLDRAVTEEGAAAFCREHGYEYNTSIFKNCFVYSYEWYTLVYYVCYDVDMHELGRFVEIEMSEEKSWDSESQAMSELVIMEKLCRPIGISPQARVKRSLYEMFRK